MLVLVGTEAGLCWRWLVLAGDGVGLCWLVLVLVGADVGWCWCWCWLVLMLVSAGWSLKTIHTVISSLETSCVFSIRFQLNDI